MRMKERNTMRNTFRDRRMLAKIRKIDRNLGRVCNNYQSQISEDVLRMLFDISVDLAELIAEIDNHNDCEAKDLIDG